MRTLFLAGLIVSIPARLCAQIEQPAVTLSTPACDTLAFAPDAVRSILVLELEGDGFEIVEAGGQAAWRLSYAPLRCEIVCTEFRLRVSGPRGEQERVVDLADVPLGAVPRALALGLSEALVVGVHASPTERAEPAPVTPSDSPSVERAHAPPSAPPNPTTSDPANPDPASDNPRRTPAQASEREPPATEPPGGPPFRFGASATAVNTPDTGGALFGARLFVDIPLGLDFPLLVRIDAGAGIGPASGGLTMGWIDGAIALAMWARAAPELALRFGPRVALGHGTVLDGPAPNDRISEVVQVGLGLAVGIELLTGSGYDVMLEGEVGTLVHGLEVSTTEGRTGLLGAYWSAGIALAFR